MSILRQIVTRLSAKSGLPAIAQPLQRNYHILNTINRLELIYNPYNCERITNLLNPIAVSKTPSCGFKVVGKLKKRCKDCYFVRREERLYVICETHPRHKQMSMVKDPKNTWILSHATQGKFRPW